VVLRIKPLEKRDRTIASLNDSSAEGVSTAGRLATVANQARPWVPTFCWLLLAAFFIYRVLRAVKRRTEVAP
jgi:hypothetical protein